MGIGDLGHLKSWVEIKDEVADEDMVRNYLPDRPLDSHKGTFGTAIIVAGSLNYSGAAMLAGMAAYRGGTGLVTLAVPTPLHQSLAGQFPEATWILLPDELGVISSSARDVLLQNISRSTAMLIGPGLGLENTTREFITGILENAKPGTKQKLGFVHREGGTSALKTSPLPPMVVDADGLKILASIKAWEKIIPGETIFTPHPGEMAILSGMSVEEVQHDRLNVARKYAKMWGHIVVLKGAFTVIASPDGRTTTIPVATPALARAGTGDVLAGLIVGLRAQGIKPYQAAIAGAWIHARAGILAEEILGSSASVMASDVLESIPEVLSEL